jgi:hypothetical protein
VDEAARAFKAATDGCESCDTVFQNEFWEDTTAKVRPKLPVRFAWGERLNHGVSADVCKSAKATKKRGVAKEKAPWQSRVTGKLGKRHLCVVNFVRVYSEGNFLCGTLLVF